MSRIAVTEDGAVRVLLVHPWGRFDPAYCGAGRAACAQLEYAQARGWDVHCVMQEIPAWGITAGDPAEVAARYACVKSVRTVRLDCPPIAPRDYGDEFRQLLYASEGAARSAKFRAIAAKPWDGCFTTDVTAAPYAHALPRGTRKFLAVGDSYARRAAAATNAPPALRDAEERFTFAHIEAVLYRLFDRVLLPSEADVANAQQHGVTSAVHIPPRVETQAATEVRETHDLLISGGERSGDLADLEWFYRHVFLPHLRRHGVRLAIAGPVATRFPVRDLQVTKVAATEAARVVVSPTCEAAGLHPPVMDALAAGRAVVTSPLGVSGLELPPDAAAVIDMRRDPVGVAAVIRDLLAAPGWRRALGSRAAGVAALHTRERHFAALDNAWAIPARSRPTLAEVA